MQLQPYNKVGWVDHIQDMTSGTVIQQGTPISQGNLNNMDDGIKINRDALILMQSEIVDIWAELKLLKDANANNMYNNVFLENFNTLDSVTIHNGIYDPIAKTIYWNGGGNNG